MASKIDIFNAALEEHLGHRPLSDTGEPVKAGRALNRSWNKTVRYCLTKGSWNFAMETIKAVADTGIEPNFGYTEVFAKPGDWLRTIGVSTDEDFSLPLTQYYDDANFWSAGSSPIYIRYVSSDTGLGFELNNWPEAFTRYVEHELAVRACYAITQSRSLKNDLIELTKKARREALSQDAMNENQPKFAPPGSWSSARGARSGRERGNRGSLTG
jgi:hypothetical protein